ncbi:hypothetical protein PHJA_001440300 [Phtheirospermum japonicum]|uniref:Uncharacterized protein n=1 Tax=Phtheirospermum japonicum TaxID=374723 RepID=A0A830BZU0_9LAMI|nr:hypothetical protein PHJA_001440300 [Phtheirospermum japonicum]
MEDIQSTRELKDEETKCRSSLEWMLQNNPDFKPNRPPHQVKPERPNSDCEENIDSSSSEEEDVVRKKKKRKLSKEEERENVEILVRNMLWWHYRHCGGGGDTHQKVRNLTLMSKQLLLKSIQDEEMPMIELMNNNLAGLISLKAIRARRGCIVHAKSSGVEFSSCNKNCEELLSRSEPPFS